MLALVPSRCQRRGRCMYLERNMITPEANLQLLLAILVLCRPLYVVFPVSQVSFDSTVQDAGVSPSYFNISLCLMIRLISSMMRELTHTRETSS